MLENEDADFAIGHPVAHNPYMPLSDMSPPLGLTFASDSSRVSFLGLAHAVSCTWRVAVTNESRCVAGAPHPVAVYHDVWLASSGSVSSIAQATVRDPVIAGADNPCNWHSTSLAIIYLSGSVVKCHVTEIPDGAVRLAPYHQCDTLVQPFSSAVRT